MKCFLFIVSCLLSVMGRGQQLVFDPQHFVAVTENGIVRETAEDAHKNYLERINNDLDNINTNVGSVVLAQSIIYNGLSNVNSALKDGMAVKNIAVIARDITSYLMQCAELAKSDPALLAFASNYETSIQTRAIGLVSDISGFILKEGDGVLADYNSRDELLRKVTQQMQIIDGLAYGAWRAMYWAKQRGVLSAANPFAAWINKDKNFVIQIIANAKYLKQ